MRKIKAICCLMMVTSLFVGCQNDGKAVQYDKVENSIEETKEPDNQPEPTDDHAGESINILTGQYVKEDIASRRPVAVVINNIHKAKPQSGIGQADIIYEVLAEGDITRLVAIFRDFQTEKLGPVRSTRHYFLDFALDNDAIFVHHGGSPLGYSNISRLAIDNLDGMREANTFWRDSVRVNQVGMYEHSSYTSSENILRDAEAKGYRMELQEQLEPPFLFAEEMYTPDHSVPTKRITIPFSSRYTRNFTFDEESKSYLVFQGDEPHIDEETGEQLKVTNVLVQFVQMRVMSGDDAGRREVDLIGQGDGYLITNGVFTPIKWEKTAHDTPTKWYDSEGNQLMLNKGKTWINIFSGEIVTEIAEQ